jgi:GNAT superfamily N-acetyltransferase
MEIEFTKHPNNADIDFLTHKINAETPEFGSAYSFAFFIKNKQKHIIAGCNGSVVFGSIYTDQLWVDPNHRHTGLGRMLMNRVHDYGREVGCTMATLATMSFQKAKAFYEKLGYQVDFDRKGYVKGSSFLFLKKNLTVDYI